MIFIHLWLFYIYFIFVPTAMECIGTVFGIFMFKKMRSNNFNGLLISTL